MAEVGVTLRDKMRSGLHNPFQASACDPRKLTSITHLVTDGNNQARLRVSGMPSTETRFKSQVTKETVP